MTDTTDTSPTEQTETPTPSLWPVLVTVIGAVVFLWGVVVLSNMFIPYAMLMDLLFGGEPPPAILEAAFNLSHGAGFIATVVVLATIIGVAFAVRRRPAIARLIAMATLVLGVGLPMACSAVFVRSSAFVMWEARDDISDLEHRNLEMGNILQVPETDEAAERFRQYLRDHDDEGKIPDDIEGTLVVPPPASTLPKTDTSFQNPFARPPADTPRPEPESGP